MFRAKFLISLTILLFAGSVFAARIDGIISTTNNQKSLIINGYKTPFVLISDSGLITKSLLGLVNGDFIAGEGKVNYISQTVKLLGIKYVGLHKLLGKWTSLSQETFEFKDYQTLIYTTAQFVDTNPNQPKHSVRTIRYHITANVDNQSWPILFTDNFASGSGRLKIKGDKVYITLFNVSGSKVREIALYRK